MTWIGGSASVAVALPSGGLQQVFVDGSQVKLLPASAAKRPAAVAVTPDGGTIAYVDQPSGSEGSGIYAGSMKAKPIDPLVILPADRSGNRYAHEIGWIDAGGRVATVIEREELGTPQGDLFYIDTPSGRPTLAWTSPSGREVWSVASFAISDDGAVVTFLTNASNPATEKPSSVWLMQIDGERVGAFRAPCRAAGKSIGVLSARSGSLRDCAGWEGRKRPGGGLPHHSNRRSRGKVPGRERSDTGGIAYRVTRSQSDGYPGGEPVASGD